MSLICYRSYPDVYFQTCNITRGFPFPQRVPLRRRVTNHGKPFQRELLLSIRPKAFETGLLFLSTPPPPRDPAVLIVTSGVLLFVYWLANFVVPGFILKAAPTEDSSEEEIDKKMGLIQDDTNSTGNGFGSSSPIRTNNKGNRKKKPKL